MYIKLYILFRPFGVRVDMKAQCNNRNVFLEIVVVLVTKSCLTLLWSHELYVACQGPLSMGFSRQESVVDCHFLLQGIFSTQGSNLSPALAGGFFTTEPQGKPPFRAIIASVQFSSVQSFSRVWLFATPWTTAHKASLSITNSQRPPKPMPIESVMPSSHLILCRPLLLLPSIIPSIRVFSSGHVWMWEMDCEESWAPKNWCFWTVVLEKTLESPWDCKEIQPVHPKGDQS